MEVFEITTTSGFCAKVDKSVMNNWELLEAFREIDKGNTALLVDVVPMFLGAEQTKALKEHLRNDAGIVPMDMMAAEIAEIMQGCKESKNLSPSSVC